MTDEDKAAIVVAGQVALREVASPLRLWSKFVERRTLKSDRQATVLGLIDATKIRVRGITTMLVDHARAKINGIPAWFRDFLAALTAGHAAAAMAALGTTELADEDIAEVDRQIQSEKSYLERFRDLVIAGSILLFAKNPSNQIIELNRRTISPYFLDRALKYPDALWRSAEEVLRGSMGRNGYDEEMRVLAGAEGVCKDCPGWAGYWAPIGSLPGIGERTRCGNRCRCHFAFRKASGVRPITPLVAPGDPRVGYVPAVAAGAMVGLADALQGEPS